MILRSWCSRCSREYSDKRWLLVEGNTVTCQSCDSISEMITDENDEAFFYLEVIKNGSR